MNTLDLLIVVIVLALAAIGYAQGFVVGAASLIGLAIGGVVGTRVTGAVIERASGDAAASAYAPAIGLVVGLLITMIGAMAMQDLGARVRGQVREAEIGGVDHLLGAVLMAIVGLLLAWVAAAAAIGMPQLRSMRPQIFNSRVVAQLNVLLPDAQPIIGVISSYDPFPEFDGGRIDTAAPDVKLPRDPQVREASRSVVRVIGTACGYQVTGSGWVAERGLVVTNAHVVGGQQDTGVQLAGQGDPIDADVVFFDRVNDLAVLRVDGLELNPLQPRQDTPEGEGAVVLGYPESRGFTATAARFSDERTVKGEDIYGAGSYERRVASFRGVVKHGNSGGPVVDGEGRVLTTVFASTVGERIAGGYGVPNDLAAQALEQAHLVPADKVVATGRCVS